MHLKWKHRTTFWGKRRLQKPTQSRVMANFAKVLKSPIFWDLVKGGPRENRSKSRPTTRAREKKRGKSSYPLSKMDLKCKYWKTFWRQWRLQKLTESKVMANFAKVLKSPIFWDLAKGGPRENRPKSRPTIRVKKTPRRKPHYPLNSMHLKGKHRTTFWRNRRLQTPTQNKVMAKVAKILKSPIFRDLAKGDQGKSAQKVGRQ